MGAVDRCWGFRQAPKRGGDPFGSPSLIADRLPFSRLPLSASAVVAKQSCPPGSRRTAGLLAHPEQLGGSRHLSAAQFSQDQRDEVALVASQDGRFTVFEWSTCEEMVHAHRVDVLLL